MGNTYKNRYLQGVDQYLNRPDSAAREMLDSAGVPTDNPQNKPESGSTSAAERMSIQEYMESRKLKNTPEVEEAEEEVGEPENTATADFNSKWGNAVEATLQPPPSSLVTAEQVNTRLDECFKLANKLVKDGKITSYSEIQALIASVDLDITLDELKQRVPGLDKREQAIASIQALPEGTTPSIDQLIQAYGKKGDWGGSTPIMGQILGVDYTGEKPVVPSDQPDPSLISSIMQTFGSVEEGQLEQLQARHNELQGELAQRATYLARALIRCGELTKAEVRDLCPNYNDSELDAIMVDPCKLTITAA